MRRTLQIVAFVGTLLIGMLALALIVSQTPWFHNWLRRFVIREAKNYVNGDVSIGSLGGDLFYGVELGDISIDVNGEHIVTLKQVEIKYSLAELVSSGMTIRQITLRQPFLLLRHDATGWNLANLVKRQQQEANRQGPTSPMTMPDIEIVNGRLAIDDRAPSDTYRLPKTVDALNVTAAYAYAPVHYSLTFNHLSFAGQSPNLTVQSLTGRVGVLQDTLNFEKMALQTPQSAMTIDGVVRNYLSNPSYQVTLSAPKLSLPELGGVLPVVQGFDLHPSLDLKADGAARAMQVTLTSQSEAGGIDGTLTANITAPTYGAKGNVTLRDLNLAPLLKDPAQKSDITGHATVDLTLAGTPASAPAVDRMRGHVVFDGPTVVAAGYTASDVRVKADIAGRRIALDARAKAYGGSATAVGSLTAPGPAAEPLALDLTGAASHVNLASLPKSLNAPRIPTDLNATAYRLDAKVAQTTTIDAHAIMGASTIAGGTIVGGTTADVGAVMASAKARSGGAASGALQSLTYASHGAVRNMNLTRVGEAFQIAALNTPEYDSRINAQYDVKGSGTTADRMQIDAAGTATDSQVFGGTLPRMAFEAHLAPGGGLKGRAAGEFHHFDPARVSGNAQYKGDVSGTVDATFGIASTSAPVTADAVSADGQITLTTSTVAGLEIDAADVQGQYANRRGNLRQATVKGPSLEVTASGPIALDDAGQSKVTYHVAASDLQSLGKLVNQPLSGSAILDGTLTGNAQSLQTTGTLDGANLGYQADKALNLKSQYTASLPNLDIAHAQVHAQSTGTFVELGAVQINELTATTTYADQKLDFQTHIAAGPSTPTDVPAGTKAPSKIRELDATGTVIFQPDHEEIHVPTLALRTQGVQWTTAPGSEAVIQYGSHAIQFQNVKLVNADQALDVDGSISLGDAPNTPGIQVHAHNVDIAQLEQLALRNDGFTGKLEANATVTGSTSAPEFSGHAVVSNGGFQQFTYQSLTVDGTYTNDQIGIDAHLVQSPGAELTAKGTMPVSALRPTPPGGPEHVAARAGDQIDVRVQSSQINLGIVQSFTKEVTNVTGTLQADAHVTGAGEDPHLSGYIEVDNGGFAVAEAGTKFSGLSTRIDLQPDVIRVPKFQILDNSGSPLTIQGDLAVHAGQAGAVNVSLESKDFKLLDNQLGKVAVDTHLKLTGELRRPRLEGDVQFDAARLELDQIMLQFASPYSTQALPDIVSAETTTTSDKGADEATRDALARGRELGARQAPAQNATAPEAAPQTGMLSALAMNVHVTAPDDMVLRGSDLRPGGANASSVGNVNATVGTDLKLQKAPDAPITLTGRINTVRGFYEFQGRRFTIDRDGTLDFHGESDLNPDVDVSGERLIPNTGVTAKVHITGTVRAPKLQLTSDPPLDEADILSLVVFNRSVNDLGTGERASLAETAGGIASGFLASSLGNSIGKALDVDLFEITTSDPETGDTAGGVTLGKQVTDKAFVRFRQQFGQRSFTEFMLEYQLAKFLRLETSVSPETTDVANRLTQRRVERAGVDLIFFFSY